MVDAFGDFTDNTTAPEQTPATDEADLLGSSQPEGGNAFPAMSGMVSQDEDPFAQASPSMPVMSGSTGPAQNNSENWTPEELAQFETVEAANQDRQRNLFEKQQAEEAEKRERKHKAEGELAQWKDERTKQIELRRSNNQELERQHHATIDEHRKGNNPWERVIDNCELN